MTEQNVVGTGPIWIRVTEFGIEPAQEGEPTLAEKQEAVEGYITTVTLDNLYLRELEIMYGRKVKVAWVNEEGILRNMEYNPFGSAFANQNILGPMVIELGEKR
jgi:hypothetical protein